MAMQDNGQGHLAFVASFVIYTIDRCVFYVLYTIIVQRIAIKIQYSITKEKEDLFFSQ